MNHLTSKQFIKESSRRFLFSSDSKMTCIEIFYDLLEDSTSVQLDEAFRWDCRPRPLPQQESMFTLWEAWRTMKNTIWVLPVRIGQHERMAKLPYIWDRERNSHPHVLLSLGAAGWELFWDVQ